MSAEAARDCLGQVTFDRCGAAEHDRNEPKVQNAAFCVNGCEAQITEIDDFNDGPKTTSEWCAAMVCSEPKKTPLEQGAGNRQCLYFAYRDNTPGSVRQMFSRFCSQG